MLRDVTCTMVDEADLLYLIEDRKGNKDDSASSDPQFAKPGTLSSRDTAETA